MTTNATCTIIRTADDGSYYAVKSYPCMWIEDKGYETKKFGEERADTAQIFITDIEADVLKGDYITREDVSEGIDVSGMLTVTSVARRDYGSADMQHVEVGAK